MTLKKKINKIKGDRMREAGVAEYKINWRNFSSKFDTWESEKTLKCYEIIQGYWWEKTMRGVIF